MKCHYTIDEKGFIFLLPGCYGTIQNNDIEDCCCTDDTFVNFEKKRYNDVLNEKIKLIKEQQQELERLRKLLKIKQT